MQNNYYLLLGDVIDSRKIENREQFQKKLINLLSELNDQYSQYLKAEFKILKGIDEFGAVFKNVSKTYEIIAIINEGIFPDIIRFVVVKGFIDIGIDKRDIEYMDGPAFHNAAKLMDDLKKSGLFFQIEIGDKFLESSFSGQINAVTLLKRHWTLNQFLVITNYRKFNNQQEIAREMDVSQQAISNNLNRSMFKEIIQIEKGLNYQFYKLKDLIH